MLLITRNKLALLAVILVLVLAALETESCGGGKGGKGMKMGGWKGGKKMGKPEKMKKFKKVKMVRSDGPMVGSSAAGYYHEAPKRESRVVGVMKVLADGLMKVKGHSRADSRHVELPARSRRTHDDHLYDHREHDDYALVRVARRRPIDDIHHPREAHYARYDDERQHRRVDRGYRNDYHERHEERHSPVASSRRVPRMDHYDHHERLRPHEIGQHAHYDNYNH